MRFKQGVQFSVIVGICMLIFTACSTPAYKQNKYKKAKRNRDCGCQLHYNHTYTMLCLNEQK
ncbi:MAG: hypothetical protein HGA37_07420 [Lentimicrobium sp.]|nr:hypothetical protein [Lentimicrobium sp.]